MAGGIVYLDVDDEITSAASRIRDFAGRRVALVLPYGSRVATSRINFRLLSRDAMINEKQLAVVAADSATRALAASAGLPVFASVAEYESSMVGIADETDATPPAAALPEGPSAVPPTVLVSAQTPVERPRRGPKSDASTDKSVTGPGRSPNDDTVQLELPRPAIPAERTWAEPRPASTAAAGRVAPGRRAGSIGARLPEGPRLHVMIALAAVALVLLVGGVGAFVALPSATIVVTPRSEPLVPVDITVTADPTAAQPDAAGRVVPAEIISLEVTANDTFPTTGKRIEEAKATGTVRFSNLDFLRSNTVAGGSIVSTNAGVRFRTVATVTVPRADLVGLTVFPGRINVNVTAVEPGLAANVEPNTIVIVPKGEDPQALKVVNPDATSDGTHDEFPQVAQEDIDAAVEQLTNALSTEFEARLADSSIATPGATVFTGTASLGAATPTLDPVTLVGQEVESFDLEMTATGTVLAVDPAPVRQIAEELLRASVEPGHELVAGSIDVEVGEPVASGQSVAFSATATGDEVAILDPEQLRKLVLGKPLDDARQILAPYGDVDLTAWPDWVGSVPTFSERVDLRIERIVPVESPAASGSSS